jgi:DeoR/GlpR family transcriptional regulator of sugar metabolism
MLEAMADIASLVKNQVIDKQEPDPEDFLLPRRAEILNIVKDQGLVNFDQIRRRFLSVNERTLRFDLKKLTDARFVTKLGTTKGVFYKARTMNASK